MSELTSFQIILQSYQDNGKVIGIGCVQWNPVYDWDYFHLQRVSNRGMLEISRPALHLLSYHELLLVLAVSLKLYTLFYISTWCDD